MHDYDFSNLPERDRKIAEALWTARNSEDGGQLTVDTLRRKFRTSRENIRDALTALSGAYPEIVYDVDDDIAMWDSDLSSPYIDPETGEDVQILGYDDFDPITPIDEVLEAEPNMGQDDPSQAEPGQYYDEYDDEDQEEHPRFKFPPKKKVEYAEKGGTCGDELAEVLTSYLYVTHIIPRKDGKGNKTVKAIDLRAVREVADQNGVGEVRGGNPGQMRMNLSNVLRAKWRKGVNIHVGNTIVRGLTSYKTAKQWMAEWAEACMKETECTRAQAEAQAEQAFAAKSEAGEYDPATGTFLV